MNAERGNTKHGPELDETMEQESRGMVQGHGRPHAEPFRETEPLPDDTDAEDVLRAFKAGPLGKDAERAPASAEDAEGTDRRTAQDAAGADREDHDA